MIDKPPENIIKCYGEFQNCLTRLPLSVGGSIKEKEKIPCLLKNLQKGQKQQKVPEGNPFKSRPLLFTFFMCKGLSKRERMAGSKGEDCPKYW